MKTTLYILATSLLLTSTLAMTHDLPPRNTLVPDGMQFYLPGAAPDRVVLTIAENPATSQRVNWRTAPGVPTSRAQIAEAHAGAGLHLGAQDVIGEQIRLDSENGLALHHSVQFNNLKPDTLYAYRVAGQMTWSEWFQFRTAPSSAEPFSFIYFGDAQNSVKSHFSRVIREARLELPRPAFMLHAGDMVNLREGVHDDEWGEWFDAGAYLYAMTPVIPVTGNHEHITLEHADGREERILSEHFSAQFAVPKNGLASLPHTTFFTRYLDTLIVVLDSTQAIENEEVAIEQARWLDALLANNDSRWVIVSHHHPIYSVSLGRDNPFLRAHWKPVYDKYGVDLVLQGHDHTYGRGDNVGEGTTLVDNEIGTVYMVSVSGPKMYFVAEDRAVHDRVGEDLQLFQLVHLSGDRLLLEARTATGEVYDAFEIIKREGQPNLLVEKIPADLPERRCTNPNTPSETRCWEGIELVY